MIIQWGRSSSAAYDKAITLNFPISFNSTNFMVVGNTFNSADGDNVLGHIKSKTKTGFTVYMFRIESKATGTRYFDWIALGN